MLKPRLIVLIAEEPPPTTAGEDHLSHGPVSRGVVALWEVLLRLETIRVALQAPC
jgi:hypothetical protein